MRHSESTFTGEGGLELFRQDWLPDGEPRAHVVVSHGASEHGGRHGYLVERLVADGFAVHIADHRGHGRSAGPRSLIDVDKAVADLHRVVTSTPRPRFLLGHSMGGCLALEYALGHQDELDGLILSSPLAALEAAPLPLRLLARGLSIVAPRTPVFAVDAEGISRDPAEVRRYVEDPLVHHGKLPARTVQELSDAIGTFPERVAALRLPLLVYHGTADRVVPIKGAEMVAAHASSEDLTFTRYEGGYHELANEGPEDRARVLDEVAGWLLSRAASPGASG
jgi:alpha-beta hydrolase superfamily lysophospholipase